MWTNRYWLRAPLVTVDRLASKSSAEKVALRGRRARILSASLRVKVSRWRPGLSDCAGPELVKRGSSELNTGSAKTASTFAEGAPGSRRSRAMVEAEGRLTIW